MPCTELLCGCAIQALVSALPTPAGLAPVALQPAGDLTCTNYLLAVTWDSLLHPSGTFADSSTSLQTVSFIKNSHIIIV